jgi:hypothetical protein
MPNLDPSSRGLTCHPEVLEVGAGLTIVSST